MSDSEAILNAIRQRRETRDRIMLQNLLPILDQLRKTVDTWIDGEFADLEEEISHVDDFAPRDTATRRINRFRAEIGQIRNNELPKALRELDELIEYIKQQKYKSAEEATEILEKKIMPILAVIFNLSTARDRLDGMADMISIPPPPPTRRKLHREQ